MDRPIETATSKPKTETAAIRDVPLGDARCPTCLALITKREGGKDTCARGHVMRSTESLGGRE